jgi:hypothetical protein
MAQISIHNVTTCIVSPQTTAVDCIVLPFFQPATAVDCIVLPFFSTLGLLQCASLCVIQRGISDPHFWVWQCHIPFIGTPEERTKCNETETCNAPLAGSKAYTSGELDFYACLNEFDEAVGTMLDSLKTNGYYDNTMIWFTTGACGAVYHHIMS